MKNKASSFLLFILLLVSSSAFSQSTGEKIRIHISPLNSFDPRTSVLQVGVQKNVGQRFALSLDHGFKMQALQKLIYEGEGDRQDYRYSKTKAELKYFLTEPSLTVVPYLSTEGMYFPQKYVKENANLIRDNINYRYTSSKIDRTVWTASLKYGTEIKLNRFVLEHFFGLGVRRLSIAHQPVGLVEEEFYQEADISFPPIDRKEGVFYRPHVSLGIKVGYML
jgi:hypothetical protein